MNSQRYVEFRCIVGLYDNVKGFVPKSEINLPPTSSSIRQEYHPGQVNIRLWMLVDKLLTTLTNAGRSSSCLCLQSPPIKISDVILFGG